MEAIALNSVKRLKVLMNGSFGRDRSSENARSIKRLHFTIENK